MARKREADTSVEGTLISLLESFGFPVYRQGSVTQGYPDNFFTFWEDDEEGNSYYDNLTVDVRYEYSVYFYSIDPDNTYSYINQARALLKQNGWVIPKRGYDVASDDQAHTGRGIDIIYLNHEID